MGVIASLLVVLGYSLRGGLALNLLWPAGFPVVLWRLGQKGMVSPCRALEMSVLEGHSFCLPANRVHLFCQGRESCDCSSPPCNLHRELYQ